jgi:hypothetical protein
MVSVRGARAVVGRDVAAPRATIRDGDGDTRARERTITAMAVARATVPVLGPENLILISTS